MRIKRSAVMAADTINWSEYLNGAFEDIEDKARRADYQLTIDGDFNMTLECTKDKDFMPIITVNTVEEKGVYYFNADMSFPDLNYDDMDYSDSAHYWVATRWEPVTRFVESINRFSYNPEEWENIERD